MFLAFSILFFALGLRFASRPAATVLIFSVLFAFIPSGNAFNSLFLRGGIYPFDFFFLACYLTLPFFGQKLTGRVAIFDSQLLILLLPVGLGLLINEVDKIFLKDLRPIIYLLEIKILIIAVRNPSTGIDASTIRKIFSIVGLLASFHFLLIASGEFVGQDEFYELNSYRYIGGTTYICIAYIIYAAHVAANGRLERGDIVPLIMSVFVVLQSNSRVLMAICVAVTLVVYGRSASRAILALLISMLLVIVFVELSEASGSERVLSALTIDGVYAQFDIRFGPAIERIPEMNFLSWLIGLGQGTSFYIPWYEWRGLDPNSSNIDGAYLTYFVKYGLYGLLMLFVHFRQLSLLKGGVVSIKSISLLFWTVIIVSTITYQTYLIGLAIGLALLSLGANAQAHVAKQPGARISEAKNV